MRTPNKTQGFTLVELLAAVAVLSVVVAGATPAIGRIADSMRMSSATNGFLAGLYLARGESIKRRGRVALCVSADGAQCAMTGGWHQGWIVFHDLNNDGRRDGAEPILRQSPGLSQGWRFSGNQTVARYVSFDPSGGTRLVSGAFQAGTLTLCRESPQPAEARQIIINAAGRARVHKATVAHCP